MCMMASSNYSSCSFGCVPAVTYNEDSVVVFQLLKILATSVISLKCHIKYQYGVIITILYVNCWRLYIYLKLNSQQGEKYLIIK